MYDTGKSGNVTCWVLVMVQIHSRCILYTSIQLVVHALATTAAVEMEDLLDPFSAAVPEISSWRLQQVRTGTPVKHVCWTHLYLVPEGIVQKRWKLFLCPRPFEQRRARSRALPLWSFLLSVRLLFSPSWWAHPRSSLHSMPLRRQLHTCRLCFCTSRRNWCPGCRTTAGKADLCLVSKGEVLPWNELWISACTARTWWKYHCSSKRGKGKWAWSTWSSTLRIFQDVWLCHSYPGENWFEQSMQRICFYHIFRCELCSRGSEMSPSDLGYQTEIRFANVHRRWSATDQEGLLRSC